MDTDGRMKVNCSVLCSGLFQLQVLEKANWDCKSGNQHRSPSVVVNCIMCNLLKQITDFVWVKVFVMCRCWKSVKEMCE